MNDVPFDQHGLGPRTESTGSKTWNDEKKLLDSPSQAVRLAMLITAVAAIIDLTTNTLNVSVVYSLPMALFARSARPASIWRIALALVALAYAGYFLGPWPADSDSWEKMLFHYRMVNRTVAASAVVGIALMSHFGIAMRRRWDNRWEPRKVQESDRDIFLEVISSFEQFQSGMMAVLAIICVAATDLISPAQYNLATLYVVPVLTCVKTRSRRFLWIVIAVCVVLVYAGYVVGPAPHIGANSIAKLQRSRRITGGVLFLVGLFVHIWIGIDYPRRRKGSSEAARMIAEQKDA
ncbi:MAG TPA: hypothetical protein VFE58_07695 [Tepidisphaeraceae bacterium]|nr:hypothetical protein [Tepidisphaeraceae bacterium]